MTTLAPNEAPAAEDPIAVGPNASPPRARGSRASVRPIVVAVDASPGALAAADAGARLARETAAPVILLHVRPGPPVWMGEPYYQRRLDAEMAVAGAALALALDALKRQGVDASTEILEGAPAKRIGEFAEARDARAVVVGTRRRRLRPSVLQKVVRASRRPVLVAPL
jgi:MFS transporter, ACDE family, multidrug resistance protein